MQNEPWIVEILLGRVPAKTEAYREKEKRREIIELFVKIQGVSAWIPDKRELKLAIGLFRRNDAMIEKLKRMVEWSYEKYREKPVQIIFMRNQIMRIEIVPSETNPRIFVKIPIIDDEAW